MADVNNQSFVVADGLRERCFDKIIGLRFNPRIPRVFYFGATVKGWHLIYANEIVDLVATPDQHWPGPAVFSPDGNHLLYWCKRTETCHVVIDGADGIPCDRILPSVSTPVFSPDGEHVAYAAQIGGKARVVVDRQPGEGFDAVGVPVFSPDGTRVAYLAAVGDRQFVVLDGKTGPPYEVEWAETGEESQHLAGSPVFSPDGCRIAYRASMDGRKCVIVDDVVVGEANDVGGLVFTPDSECITYRVFPGNGREGVSIDGSVVEFDSVWSPGRCSADLDLWDPVCDENSRKMAFGAQLGRDLLWKVINW